ncbi:quinolinate synthase, L-aspartate oxidase (B protein) subunit [Magnetospirillum gryphiswaldense MSR-1 v2]|uniref:L-aspartate oxidase n=1 Tax=Magnetospirillum gryphiswaldense (strain DSM 6361 / JCM 21280 / NBRC 15271 / MSR-1) TaxID=431944 RepID=V6F0M1_MAGGM|nr:L-aspartate oxidase [Magnetospirillum gryphiswaldense]CDK99009.1 quinolinate synthase, L-aspartate oxidase (B protein) subunit [Magnetospirillum gryphiswaldense MSR-1 v2]
MSYDLLVIGSGAAGLSLALRVLEAKPQARIAILAKGPLSEGSTMYAQGGIAAVLDAADTTDAHLADTLTAGGGLCNAETVRFVVDNAKPAIQWLIDNGVLFDREGGDYHLTREGGHSHRRVIHSADATGKAVQTALMERILESGAEVFEHHIAVDLIRERLGGGRLGRCVGAYALDRSSGRVITLPARAVVLATGGASRVYLYSSNPDGSTGDGIAMAWRAGCRVSNMEFSQFHPTCLYHPKAKTFLVTEAVRGEGGHLLRPDGTRFMDDYDPRGELAPRDVVARAIDDVMKRLGCPNVYLDISHKPADFIKSHFPTVYAECLKFGIDMTREPIPVVPAAHYTCGGVLTDLSGRTDVPNLYAIGEVSCTGLHGANRMASNSLLECLVFGAAAATDIAANMASIAPPPVVAAWDESWVTDSDEEVVVAHNWDELRRFMWDYVGIVRSTKRLERAKHRIKLLLSEIAEYYGTFRVTNDLLELRNLAMVADLIVRSALSRRESRGLHYTIDYPDRDAIAPAQNTVLVPKNFTARRQN